jgi:beta-lactamase class C
LGQLATHTSGLLLPQDHPPWPDWGYTLPEFIRTLNAWTAEEAPGRQHRYTHAGFILLQLALERRYGVPIDELIERRLLQPLGMSATLLPRADDGPRGRIPDELKVRAVQGYSDSSEPIGAPGDQTGYYHWAGIGQMYSSARDISSATEATNIPTSPAGGFCSNSQLAPDCTDESCRRGSGASERTRLRRQADHNSQAAATSQ